MRAGEKERAKGRKENSLGALYRAVVNSDLKSDPNSLLLPFVVCGDNFLASLILPLRDEDEEKREHRI